MILCLGISLEIIKVYCSLVFMDKSSIKYFVKVTLHSQDDVRTFNCLLYIDKRQEHLRIEAFRGGDLAAFEDSNFEYIDVDSIYGRGVLKMVPIRLIEFSLSMGVCVLKVTGGVNDVEHSCFYPSLAED